MTIPWRLMIGGALSIKFAAFGIGYAAWFVGAETASKKRQQFLGHASDVFYGLESLGKGVEGDARTQMIADIDDLTRGIRTGWRTSGEVASFLRVLSFISRTHAKSTTDVFTDLAGKCYRTAFGNLLHAPSIDERAYFG